MRHSRSRTRWSFSLAIALILVVLTSSLALPGQFWRAKLFRSSIVAAQNAPACDSSAGGVRFRTTSYIVGERSSSATITVERTGTLGAVTVNYATSDGTATAGSDYTSTSGTLSFADGEGGSKNFNVPIINDTLDEPDETINLTLSNPTGGAFLDSPSTMVITIRNNQGASCAGCTRTINETRVIQKTVNLTFGTINASPSSFSKMDFGSLDAIASRDLLNALICRPGTDPQLVAALRAIRDGNGGANPTNLEFLTANTAQTEIAFGASFQRVEKPSDIQNIFDVGELYSKGFDVTVLSKTQTLTPNGTVNVVLDGGTVTTSGSSGVGGGGFQDTTTNVQTVGDVEVNIYNLTGDVVAQGRTFVVNSTGDGVDNNLSDGLCNDGTGNCTLRAAIQQSNASVGQDTINFNIPGAGVKTITPTSALPAITDSVIIDGYTQPGASANTLAVGNNAVLLIELNGTSAGALVEGLTITAGSSTVRGLVINRFNGDGIRLNINGGNFIEGNFIGTDVNGTAGLRNFLNGVRINNVPNNTIGGTTIAARNVLSANQHGISIEGANATGNQVQGNFIGTDKNGTAALGNDFFGVFIAFSAVNNIIGGTTVGARNVISGNLRTGINLAGGTTGNRIQGNLIGTQVDGVSPLGNQRRGLDINSNNNTVGGTLSGAGNTIAFNDRDGVSVIAGIGNSILSNSIHSNAGIGIDLIPAGGEDAVVTPNDPGDADTGANNLQNFPVLTLATSGSGTTTMQGTLNSTANTTFRVEFFSNPACDPSGNGEGQTFIGAASVTTVGNDATINVVLPITVPAGQLVTSTATNPADNTSEFSQCVQVTAAPTPDVSIAVSPLSAAEGGSTNLVYTFSRTGNTTTPLTVNFSVGGTANFNTDYSQSGAATFTSSSGTATFGAGNSTAAVTVDPTSDIAVEPDETVILTVTSGTGYNVGNPSAATGIIANDDTDVSVAVSPPSAAEDGATNLVYTFSRTGNTTSPLTVSFSVGGTATLNTDYSQSGAASFASSSGTVTFGAGNSTASVTVDPTSDITVEPDETVILTVASGTGYNVGSPSAATGTITNDDTDVSVAVSPLSAAEDGATNLVYTFSRAGNTSALLTVSFSVGGTATLNTDYSQSGAASFASSSGTVTFGAGNSTASVTVDPTSDITVEPDETVILTVASGTGYNVGSPSAATGTITNDDGTPGLSINDVSVAEGNSGTTNAVFVVTMSAPSSLIVTVNFATADGTATQGNDYQSTSGLLTFNPGDVSKTITVPVNGDITNEANETFFVNLSNSANANIADNQGVGTILNDDTPVFNFSLFNYTVSESGGSVLITVIRTGDPAPPVGVDYITTDNSNPADFILCSSSPPGTASSRCDFNTALGTLRFAANEITKTFNVLITQDSYVEGTESLQLFLSDPTGGAVLGAQSISTLQILDDVPETSANPILDARNFVRQHYHDFLNREPDQPGWDFWTDNISKCNDPARLPAGQTLQQCLERQVETTSGAFFISPEYQYTGFYIYCVYRGSLGRMPTFLELMRDVQQVSRGIVIANAISGATIEQNRAQYETEFIQRPEFLGIYGQLDNQGYVDKLFMTTGVSVSTADKQALVTGLNGGTETRATVLHKVVNGTRVISEGQADIIAPYGKAFTDSQFNAAFVQMEYFGYLRRNSDAAGFNHWLDKMNSFGDFLKAEMVRSFLISPEYLQRFASP